ncbi:DUF3800 domain-containing protein [uncultured Stenotrophomonas sp.]|uniref:DUF3800 domain-containing protein n=1 Tax=uncultured Stenotrophomonas sp. TaxID=165438 RepID=UPI0025FF3266|nr:DUF3800 domain-containing protein [uncultured Stenotrophomonas sp.]
MDETQFDTLPLGQSDEPESASMKFVYIDESGHTGDLVNTGRSFEFGEQPHFVLAAVGPMSSEQASRLLDDIVAKHRLHQMRELKSELLHRRPGVARDLARALGELDIPIFIEVVDKALYLIVSIINSQIIPPGSGPELDEGEVYLRNRLADYLYTNLPDSVLGVYVDACKLNSPEAVRASLVTLQAWAEEAALEDDPEDRQLLYLLRQSMGHSLEVFDFAMKHDPQGHNTYLPLPDEGKQHATYWLLPNYSSLTNLYARINKCCAGRLSDVTLVHDGQTQYDEVLRAAKANVETFVDTSDYEHPGADYSFVEHAGLAFESSAQTPGLMIADVIAGHVRRVMREHAAESDIHPQAWDAFLQIWDAGNLERGTGMNLVLPTATVDRLHHRILLRRHERTEETVAPRLPKSKSDSTA